MCCVYVHCVVHRQTRCVVVHCMECEQSVVHVKVGMGQTSFTNCLWSSVVWLIEKVAVNSEILLFSGCWLTVNVSLLTLHFSH